MDKDVDVVVTGKRELVAELITELTLESSDGTPLESWEPGAHIEVVLPSGLIRHYSLCGDPTDDFYTIAVLREAGSRGGSLEVHEQVSIGSKLTIRGPRNHFALEDSEHSVFIAGGIGITPLLPMMRRLSSAGKSWELHYGGRSLASLAYLDALNLMEGSPVNIYVKDETRRIPVSDVVRNIPTGSTIYVCGPESMIVDVEREGQAHDVPVKLERFGPSGIEISHDSDAAFTVELRKSGSTLSVAADQRLIDVVRTVVPSVPFSCEEGYCGSCETTVLEGEPEHRDSILSPEERSANDCMMICVGRARTPHLVLDL